MDKQKKYVLLPTEDEMFQVCVKENGNIPY